MMKRVLHVAASLDRGGTESYIMNVVRFADSANFVFSLFTFDAPAPQLADELNALDLRVYLGRRPAIRHVVGFVSDLRRHLVENGPYDAVHSHADAANSWVMLAAKLARVPVRVAHVHAVAGGGGALDIRSAMRWLKVVMTRYLATHHVSCSSAAGEAWFGSSFFSRRGEVLHNGIDFRRFARVAAESVAELRQHLSLDEHALILGNVTRFDPNKNIEFVVDVFDALQASIPNALLVLGGPDAGTLSGVQERVDRLGLTDKVRYVGPRTDVEVLLHVIDVYIFPSKSEGLGIAVLEAQAAGTSVFASSAVPLEVDVGLGLVQFLNVSKGAHSWARAIAESHRSNGISEEQVGEAFERSGYSVADTVRRLEEIYCGQ